VEGAIDLGAPRHPRRVGRGGGGAEQRENDTGEKHLAHVTLLVENIAAASSSVSRGRPPRAARKHGGGYCQCEPGSSMPSGHPSPSSSAAAMERPRTAWRS